MSSLKSKENAENKTLIKLHDLFTEMCANI